MNTGHMALLRMGLLLKIKITRSWSPSPAPCFILLADFKKLPLSGLLLLSGFRVESSQLPVEVGLDNVSDIRCLVLRGPADLGWCTPHPHPCAVQAGTMNH